MKKVLRIFTLLLNLYVLSACTSLLSYKTIRYFDSVNNVSVIKMEPNKIGRQLSMEETVGGNEKEKPADQVFVNLMVNKDSEGKERYYAEVVLQRYVDHSWGRVKSEDYLLIKPGVSLCLTVEGDPMMLVVDKPSRPDLTADNPNQEQTRELIEETAVYKLSREQVVKIVEAKSVAMKLSGEHGELSLDWSAWNIRNVRYFWESLNPGPKG